MSLDSSVSMLRIVVSSCNEPTSKGNVKIFELSCFIMYLGRRLTAEIVKLPTESSTDTLVAWRKFLLQLFSWLCLMEFFLLL
jgi:hypothetical protein